MVSNFDRLMDLYCAIADEVFAATKTVVVHYFVGGCRCVGVYICHWLCRDIYHQIYKFDHFL